MSVNAIFAIVSAICILVFQAAWDLDKKPPEEWPDKGAVEVIEYSTRYRAELEPVIKDVSVSIKGGEKVNYDDRKYHP